MKKLRLFMLFSVLLLASVEIFATAQIPNKIIYKGKEYQVGSDPMEGYFKKFPEKKPQSEVRLSALWRGYIATFELNDNALFLKDIVIVIQEKGSTSFGTKSVLSEVVPSNKKLKIDWFRRLLLLPHGEIIEDDYAGYETKYENYILLEIDAGNLMKTKEFDYKQFEDFSKRQYEAFKKTEDYKELTKDDKDGSFDSYLRKNITSYTSKILVD